MNKDVLEQNVSTLLESGGERPQISDTARARIRAELVAKHGVVREARSLRRPLVALAAGVVATVLLVVIVGRFVGSKSARHEVTREGLADGSTYVLEPGAKVTPLGMRHVRVEGAALLDVVPGKGEFVVETAHGRVTVLGTKFVVDGERDKTTAAVIRGSVKLASSDGSVVLHAGEQGVAEPGRPPSRGPAPRLSHLVSWAQQARAKEEHAVEPLHHGTLFARDPGVRSHPPWGPEYPLPIVKLGLDVVVENQVARIALDQTFRNNENQDLEGVYRFAIPPDAALQRLAMYVDGKLTESAVVERMRARRIYEELVYRRVDPALLEWAGTGRLNLRVYPLPALQDKRLLLAYTQSLPKLYSDWTLSIPLPEVDQPVGNMEVAVRVKGCANCELTSTSHAIKVEREGDDAIVKYQRASEKIGDSFVVHVRDPRQQTTVAMHEQSGERYMLVRAPGNLGGGPREYRPRTWVILDDVSASRTNLELRAQADVIDAFLRELDEDDRVSIVAFDVEAREKLAPTRVLDVDRRKVRKALDGEGSVGATDFAVALDAAMARLAGVDPDDAMIVYVGDGVITSGARNLDALREKLAGKAHFVGVGIGDGPDTQTLQGLAAATGGYATTIDLSDDLGWRSFDLVAALHTSRVTGLEARLVDGSGTLVPATVYLRSPQLADGEELELVAKLAGSGTPARVELTGTLNGAPWQKSLELDEKSSKGAGFLPRMWAQQHIAARLLAKHEAVIAPPCTAAKCPTDADLREQRDETIRKEVVALGKQYFLLSRHTSLLVLENDEMYQQYGVTKGAGDTWAPYVVPPTIPVVKHAATAVATSTTTASTNENAELIRAPLQIFYNYAGYRDRWADDDFSGFADDLVVRHGLTWQQQPFSVPLGTLTITTMPTTAAVTVSGSSTRSQLKLTEVAGVDGKSAARDEALTGELQDALARDPARREELQQRVASSGLLFALDNDGTVERAFGNKGGGFGRASGRYGGYAAAGPTAQRFTYPNEPSFDDLSAFVPALLPGPADLWRAALEAGAGEKHTIDDAAKQLLADARSKLPSGVYRWGDYELAVDSAHRIGWRRTTEMGLDETASYDGSTWTRRYRELGLDVTRAVGADDVALGLGYLPVWIAPAEHYAKWFDVKARGREVVLSRQVRGKQRISVVLKFDADGRLVSISDSNGAVQLEVAWGTSGPLAARVNGEDLSVGFTGQPIADAVQWAHGDSRPGIAVDLPAHAVKYWDDRIANETKGSPAWRHLMRQRMVAEAATQNRNAVFASYEALRQNGGVELGDLVLASGGIATVSTDEQFAKALASLGDKPFARYLIAGRAYGKSPSAERMKPETRDGFAGALWTLRYATAQLAVSNTKLAADAITAIPERARDLRLVGASLLTYRYTDDFAHVARAWDAAAIGPYRNVARTAAAYALMQRGKHELAAERLDKLVDELDLSAEPPSFANLQYVFSNSRRGVAGWNIVWARWRDRAMAGKSYAHVMALLGSASQPAEVTAILTRASELAGNDADKQVELARVALSRGQAAWAEARIRALLPAQPTHDMYQLIASIELQQSKFSDALDHLEAAQDAGADEAVNLATVQGELAQIIYVARSLAQQSSGAARQAAVDRAMKWAARWRAVDPGNAQIDQNLGEMFLSLGDAHNAWRQLSTTIERDPWSGTGYTVVADAFERQGKVEESLPFWQQAIVIDQTNPTPRLRKAQALIALGRTQEGDLLLSQIANQKWHDIWSGVVWQAKDLIERGKRRP